MPSGTCTTVTFLDFFFGGGVKPPFGRILTGVFLTTGAGVFFLPNLGLRTEPSLFNFGGGGINTPSVGGFGSHAQQQQQQQQQRFGLFNAPLSSSSYSRPYGNGLDQAPAPLLALLESKASHVLEQ